MTDQTATRGARKILIIGTGAIGVAFLPVLVTTLAWRYGKQVRVALTATAHRLVSAESLSALSGHPVAGPQWPADASAGAQHVLLAEWADLVLVWPATLDFCARCAHGLGSDVPSATVAAARGPVVMAPSMAAGAADGAAYRRVARLLTESGVQLVGPVVGREVGLNVDSPGACVGIPELLHTIAPLLSEKQPASSPATPSASPNPDPEPEPKDDHDTTSTPTTAGPLHGHANQSGPSDR